MSRTRHVIRLDVPNGGDTSDAEALLAAAEVELARLDDAADRYRLVGFALHSVKMARESLELRRRWFRWPGP